jgi:hypothetical protein
LELHGGAAGVIIQSFATNTFDGPVHLRRAEDPAWREMPHTFPAGYGRSVGLADMAHALRAGRDHRASGELGFAVLDVMQGFLESAESGRAYEPSAPFKRPAPMPAHLPFGVLDD